MKVAVVGATGLVGSKMLQVLAERNFPVTELIPVASERSVGKEVTFKGKKYKVVGMTDGIAAKRAKICRSRNYSDRQFFCLENGPVKKTGCS
jgi:aspartate-semialdehyde dehydrogenase